MSPQSWDAFAEYVDIVMAAEQVAGCAVGVSQGGRTLYLAGHGLRDVSRGLPVTPDTVFGAASVSKSFSALAIMQLAAQERLDPGDPVVRHLPGFRLPSADGGAGVQIHHLLSHTTGVPPLKRRPDLPTFASHLAYIAAGEYDLLGPPGAYLSYSNDLFLLLGMLIEAKTDRTYLDYVEQSILSDIGMERSTVRLSELARMDNVAVPYTFNPVSQRQEPQDYAELGRYDVGGAVRTTVRDLLRYGDALAGDGGPAVPARHVRRMWEPAYPLAAGWSYGYGLEVNPGYGGSLVVKHGGNQIGVASYFGFVPERGIVVAVLTNTTRAPARDIWHAALNTSLGLPLDYGRPAGTGRQPSMHQLRRLVGRYGSAEGTPIEVNLRGGGLSATQEGVTAPLTMAGANDAFADLPHREEWVKFHTRGDEDAWALFRGLRMLRRLP